MASSNAIGWVQFKLLGGTRNLCVTSVAYAIVVIAVMFLATQLENPPSFAVLGRGAPVIMSVQLIVLLLYGTLRVGHAVRLDVNGSMIESHRLMPVSSISAVLGYLFGSTAQAFSLFVINIVLGAACVSVASVSPGSRLGDAGHAGARPDDLLARSSRNA